MEPYQIKRNQLAPIIGLIACSIFYIAIAITLIPFKNQEGGSFSFFNHFISELGNPIYSEYHFVFNYGIMIAGFGFGVFSYCLGGLIRSKLAWFSIYMGMIASVLCIGIGIFPANQEDLHLLVAASFFSLMTIAMALYSYCILKDSKKTFPKYIAYYGFTTLVFFILLILSPKELIAVQNEQGAAFDRPEIWMVTIIEWIVFFFLTSWVILVSLHLLALKRSK